MGIKTMLQSISSFVHLGDGCSCTIATVEIKLDEGRITAIIRNGADGADATHVFIIDQFGEHFMGSSTREPNNDCEIAFSVKTLETFDEFDAFTQELYGCTYGDLRNGDMTWDEILSNFFEVSLYSGVDRLIYVGNDRHHLSLSDDVAIIAGILSNDKQWES